MILRPSPTLWGWLLTSVADDAGTRHVDVSLATLLCLRNTSNALQNAFYAPTKFTKYANLLNTSSTNTFFKETILLILQTWTSFGILFYRGRDILKHQDFASARDKNMSIATILRTLLFPKHIEIIILHNIH